MQGFNDFGSNLRFVVGNGVKIRFWENCWLESLSVCLKFPRLYKFASSQCASMRETLSSKKIKEENSSISLSFKFFLKSKEHPL